MEPKEADLARARVENKNIDLIELQLHLVEWDSEYGSGVREYYHCNYVMQIPIENFKEKLWAKSKPIYKHFFSRQIVGVVWGWKRISTKLKQ